MQRSLAPSRKARKTAGLRAARSAEFLSYLVPRCTALALLVLIAGIAPAQEKTTIRTSGEEVLVDVVVRDKKGHAVTGLPQSAFTVTDEGRPCSISSFRLVIDLDP